MGIQFSRYFQKQYKKLPTEIKAAFEERLELFKIEPHNFLLKNHALRGGLQGYRSINVTGNFRALYIECEQTRHIIFKLIGTHSELYK